MSQKLKYMGVFGNKYKIREWAKNDMLNSIAAQPLITKQDVIKYLVKIKIHEDSIEDFIKFYREINK